MKKIKLALLTLIPAALSFSLAACSGCSNTNKESSGGGDSSGDSSAIPEGYVRVTFYIDYNQPINKKQKRPKTKIHKNP